MVRHRAVHPVPARTCSAHRSSRLDIRGWQCRHQFAESRFPAGVAAGEAATQQVGHDRGGRRGPGGRPEQTGDTAVRGGDELGAESQFTDPARMRFDHLGTLPGLDQGPVGKVRGGVEPRCRRPAVYPSAGPTSAVRPVRPDCRPSPDGGRPRRDCRSERTARRTETPHTPALPEPGPAATVSGRNRPHRRRRNVLRRSSGAWSSDPAPSAPTTRRPYATRSPHDRGEPARRLRACRPRASG